MNRYSWYLEMLGRAEGPRNRMNQRVVTSSPAIVDREVQSGVPS